MAKENKKAAEQKSTVVTNESNIVENLKKGITGNDKISDDIEAEIKKQDDDRIKRQILERCQQAKHDIQRGYLEVIRNRALDAESLRKLANVDRIARGLRTFEVTEEVLEHAAHSEDVVGGIKEVVNKGDKTLTITIGNGKPTTYKLGDKVPTSINYVDYDKYREEISNESRKRISEIEAEHTQNNNYLDASFGEYYNPRWRRW